jgi:hypothetical protein
LELLRPLRSSAGDLVPYYHSSGSKHTHKAFRLIIFVCDSHKICYIIIWHALFQSLYIYIYGQSGCRWYSSILGAGLGHANWEVVEMPNLELEGREAYNQHSATPLTTFNRNSFASAVLVPGAWTLGEKIRYYPPFRIHANVWTYQIWHRSSGTTSWER